MSLARPMALLFAPLLGLVAVLAYRLGQRRWRRFRDALNLGPLPPLGGIQMSALAVGAVSLGVALAGPVLGVSASAPVHSDSRVVLAVDISPSMTVSDVAPQRMMRARMAAQRVIAESEARVGLVAFAAEAHVLLPPTDDAGLLALYLEALDPTATSAPGSDLAAAVRTALATVGTDSTTARHVVIISDGEGFEEAAELRDAVALAKSQGVRIHGLLVGSSGGGVVPGIPGSYSSADAAALEVLAAGTGGSVFREADRGARALVAAIDVPAPVPSPVPEGPRRAPVDLGGWLAVLALAALVVESGVRTVRRRLA